MQAGATTASLFVCVLRSYGVPVGKGRGGVISTPLPADGKISAILRCSAVWATIRVTGSNRDASIRITFGRSVRPNG